MPVKFTSNASAVLGELDRRIKMAGEIIGGMAEGYAKALAPVDTGLLRNSITHALGGEPPAISKYKDDKGLQTGSYSGVVMPKDGDGQVTVYVGTNVQYAPYQELGAPNAHVPPHPFLRPAVENHTNEYQDVLKSILNK